MEATGNGHLAVLHAGRDLRKQHVAFAKYRVALLDLAKPPYRRCVDAARGGRNGCHRDEGDFQVIG